MWVHLPTWRLWSCGTAPSNSSTTTRARALATSCYSRPGPCWRASRCRALNPIVRLYKTSVVSFTRQTASHEGGTLPVTIGRRELIAALGGVATWPLAVRAQQAAMPVVGYLSSLGQGVSVQFDTAFRRGLSQMGYVEGQKEKPSCVPWRPFDP